MKTMKKVFALALALILVMGLSVTAFAAGETYSITIKDAVSGETYNAYKIFDATYEMDTTDPTKIDSISYTIKSDSQWYSVMQAYTQDVTTTDEYGNETTIKVNPFTFAPSKADSSVIVVTLATYEDENGETQTYTVDPATLAAYLNNNLTDKKADVTAEATDTTVTLDVSSTGAGYYFVDTSLGALCSLNNVTGTEVTMYEKNSAPKIEKKVQEDDNNSTHTGDAAYADTAILDVIDTVSYQLTVNTGTDGYTDNATGVDDNYVIVDTLPTGIAYKDNTIAVSVTADGTTTDWVENTDYTVSWTAAVAADATTGTEATPGTLKITLLSTGKLASLAEDTNIVITYDATITASEVDMTNTGNTNKVTLTYKSQESTDTAVVKTYDLLNDEEGETPSFQKVDGNGDALEGVTFVLSRDVKGTDDEGNETTTTQYAVVDSNYYLTKWGTKDEASPLVTDANGSINVLGLDAGTYILTETATLNGYNKLTDTITVVIAEDGEVTYKLTSSAETPADASTITVVNETGTELPSTGGIGTTIFYVVGSILVIGAAVLLITKKRMNGAAE